MTPPRSDGPTRAAVRAQLDRVTDPELDRSIVALEYIDRIEIDGDCVSVAFTLPTAWCSPAFAWMMAVDARDAVESLQAVENARITLREHMHEAEITHGVNESLSFSAAFPDADGDVEAVRTELDEKARIARQYNAIEALREAGLEPDVIVRLRLQDLEGSDLEHVSNAQPNTNKIAAETSDQLSIYIHNRSFAVTVPRGPIERYLEKAHETGVLSGPDDILFRTPEGEPIDADAFDLVHRRGRLAQVNMSSQGGICDGLREARDGRPTGVTTD